MKLRRLVCAASASGCLLFVGAAHAAAGYKVVDLGTGWSPSALNNNDEVVGNGNGQGLAKVWSAGRLVAVPPIPGYDTQRVLVSDVNDNGIIVGSQTPALQNGHFTGLEVPFEGHFDPSAPSSTGFQLLPTLENHPYDPNGWSDGAYTWGNGPAEGGAIAIANNGWVVGYSDHYPGFCAGDLCEQKRGVVWTNPTSIYAVESQQDGILPFDWATQVTSTQVVDRVHQKDGNERSDLRNWGPCACGVNTDMVALDRSPDMLNDQGWLVGQANGTGTLAYGTGELLSPGGQEISTAPLRPYAINSSNQVVGDNPGTGHAMLRQPDGTLVDLNNLIPAGSGWVLQAAQDINDKGDIIGWGTLNGVGHAFLLTHGTLDVTLDAYDELGNPLNGSISRSQDVDVVEKITNNTGFALHGLTFARNKVLGAEPGSGGIQVSSGPSPAFDPKATLAAGKSLTFDFVVSGTKVGRSAVDTKLTALDPDGGAYTGQFSLRFDIGDGQKLNQAVANFLQIQAMDAFMRKAFMSWRNFLDDRAHQLYGLLSRAMSRAQRIRWFGSAGNLAPSVYDDALAVLRSSSPDLVAAQMPRVNNLNLSADQLKNAYDQAFAQKVGEGVSDYVHGWGNLGSAAQNTLEKSWREAALTFDYYWGSATPEERSQFEAQAMHLVDTAKTAGHNFVTQASNESHHLLDDGVYVVDAYAHLLQDAFGDAPDLQAALAQEKLREANWIRNAPNDPLQFERDMAQRDAEIFNAGLTTTADQLIGGAAARVGGWVVKGLGGSIIRAGEASGVLDSAGKVAGAPTIPPPDLSIPGGVPAVDAASLGTEGQFLGDTKNATVIEARDTGSQAYKVDNIGGVPETVIDAKAGVLEELQNEYKDATGQDIKLAEVLKPGTPLEKEGGVAKLELTEQKTLKPVELSAGMPEDALGEAGVWRSTTPPDQLPGWDSLSEPQQEAAQNAWEKANAAWDNFEKPTPGSKTARRHGIGVRRLRQRGGPFFGQASDSVPLVAMTDQVAGQFRSHFRRSARARHSEVDVHK